MEWLCQLGLEIRDELTGKWDEIVLGLDWFWLIYDFQVDLILIELRELKEFCLI